jgi:hypothetical protein
MPRWIGLLLALAVGLAAVGPPVRCTTRYNRVFDEWRVECTDGSRAVTKWNPVFQEWRTGIVRPGAAATVAPPRGEERRRR